MVVRSVTICVACLIFCALSTFAETDMKRREGFDPLNIQNALANAGYYTASVDGIMGKRTRAAIRAFQEANHLKVDGICGPETWHELRAFLDVEPEAIREIMAKDTVALEWMQPVNRELSKDELKQKLV